MRWAGGGSGRSVQVPSAGGVVSLGLHLLTEQIDSRFTDTYFKVITCDTSPLLIPLLHFCSNKRPALRQKAAAALLAAKTLDGHLASQV